MDKMIEEMLQMEQMEMNAKFNKLAALCVRLDVDSMDKLKTILEFTDLFRECNRNGWLEFKEDN